MNLILKYFLPLIFPLFSLNLFSQSNQKPGPCGDCDIVQQAIQAQMQYSVKAGRTRKSSDFGVSGFLKYFTLSGMVQKVLRRIRLKTLLKWNRPHHGFDTNRKVKYLVCENPE